MAIKPIDMQVMMPRVNEVSRIQNDEQHRSLAVAQNKVQNTEKDSENSMKQVNSRQEAQKTMIRDKQQKEKREGKQQSKEKKSNDGESGQKTDKNKTSGRTIDIRL